MTAPASDEHRPLSAGATALAPQSDPAVHPAPAPARRPRPRRAAAPAALPARPTARTSPAGAAAPAAEPVTAPSRTEPRPGRPPARAPRPASPAPLAGPTALARARAKAARAQRAPRAPFVILLLVLMASGLLCLLLLNTALSENAFHAHSLQARSAQLADEEQALAVHADQLSAPGALASRAAALGMAAGGLPQYLPPGATLPPGARVVAGGGGDAAGGVIFYVVPAPAPARPAGVTPTAPANQGQPVAGQVSAAPSAPAATGTGTSGR